MQRTMALPLVKNNNFIANSNIFSNRQNIEFAFDLSAAKIHRFLELGF